MSTITPARPPDDDVQLDGSGVQAPERRGALLDEARLNRSVLALTWPVLV